MELKTAINSVYRSTAAPKMYISKNGKDDLLVSSFDIVFDVIGSSPATQIKFTCPGVAVRVKPSRS